MNFVGHLLPLKILEAVFILNPQNKSLVCRLAHVTTQLRKLPSPAKDCSCDTMTDPTRYRFIGTGKGGTFRFKDASYDSSNHETLRFIGTDNCETCVGCYWAINDGACFVAHTNAWIETDDGGREWVPDFADVARLKYDVKARLDAENLRAEWNGPTDRMRQSLVLVCPHARQVNSPDTEIKNVGWYVVDAIREWLKAPGPQPDPRYQGFVVEHPGGMVKYFSHNVFEHADVAPPEMAEWREQLGKGQEVSDWAFPIKRII